MIDKFLTIDEVSEMLRVHRNTVIRWLNAGRFPNAIHLEATNRIPYSDIENLKRKQA